jgi:2-polyprenyl-3-methyl-5-hydroxy-6-metoxy-1,4-benzoquinol methylase
LNPPGTAAEKYELKPFRYSSHYQILKLLEGRKDAANILDVGTAGGYLGRILKARNHRVTGIECDPVVAEAAKPYYDAFQVADIEKFEFPYRAEFDYILFADVLEHLRNPADVLRKCIPALKPSGEIVISLPNVANFTVRLGLLLGQFNYTERGILDKTHLRFFTLRSVMQMMREVSCEILEIVATPVPVQIVLPFTESRLFAPLHEILYFVTRSWKTAFGYQFVVLAVPAGRELPGA